MALGGATRPLSPSCDKPDGKVPGVGWSIRLAADWAKAGDDILTLTTIAPKATDRKFLFVIAGCCPFGFPGGSELPGHNASGWSVFPLGRTPVRDRSEA